MELLSPKIDVVFKALFSSADSEEILTDFLASVLDIKNDDIK
ncbi:MAG: PD-(D/E)XK nuclease family transposase, partial [Candidatus Ornithomonoglobus sp.]